MKLIDGYRVKEKDWDKFKAMCYIVYTNSKYASRLLPQFRRILNNYRIGVKTVLAIAGKVIKGDYRTVYYLKKANAKLIRAENVGKICYYDSALHVFTISEDYELSDLINVREEILSEQIRRWGGALDVHDTYELEYEISSDKYNAIKQYLDSFNIVARDSRCWKKYNYTPPRNFVVSDHILAHLIICGIKPPHAIPDLEIFELIDEEFPCIGVAGTCIDEELHTSSQSLYVMAFNTATPRCQLWKRGGWNPPRTIQTYLPPSESKKRSRTIKTTKKIERTEETESMVGEIKEVKEFNIYPNPLSDKPIHKVHKKFRKIMKFLYENGLNPIPLAKDSKSPLKGFRWKYLHNNPITLEDFLLFEKDINIGIVCGYNNFVALDIDVNLYPDIILDQINTTVVKTPHGYHVYFFTDRPFTKVYSVKVGGKVKYPVAIKSSGYVVAPPSTYKGMKYVFVSDIKPAYIEHEKLEKLVDAFFKEYRDKIIELIEKGEGHEL